MKQAKDEATEEIEKYRTEREKQFKDFEAKVSISCCKCNILQVLINMEHNISCSTSDHAKVLLKRLTLILEPRLMKWTVHSEPKRNQSLTTCCNTFMRSSANCIRITRTTKSKYYVNHQVMIWFTLCKIVKFSANLQRRELMIKNISFKKYSHVKLIS